MPQIRNLLVLCNLLMILHFTGEPCLAAAEKPTVYFGINLRYNPRTLYSRYQPLMEYLTENTPYRFELKVSRDYQEALKDLKEGRTLIASLGDGAFVEAIILHGAIPLVKPLDRDGMPFYRCAIIVPRNSAIHSLQDLKGKHFAFGSHHSVTGNLVPRFLLQQAGVNYRDLGSATALKNHDAVTKAILKGQYDAGAVKGMFAAKYRDYGLRVVGYSSPIPSVPLMVRRDAPRRLKIAVARALLKLDPGNPAHREIMSDWDEEFQHGFAPASVQDYREIMQMFSAVPFGCGTRCH